MRARSLIVLILVLAACGREGAPLVSPSPTPRPSPTSSPEPEDSPTPEPTETPTPSPSPSPTAAGTDAPNCRNSTEPACGAFRFEPSPSEDDEIEVDVTFMPRRPKAGDEVTFDLQASDPDSQFLYLGTYRFARQGPGIVADDPPGSCPRAFGPWVPPSDEEGSTSKSLSYTYREAGEYQALFTFFSHSYTDDDHPWPDRPPGDEDGECIDPRASSGKMTVTVNVTE